MISFIRHIFQKQFDDFLIFVPKCLGGRIIMIIMIRAVEGRSGGRVTTSHRFRDPAVTSLLEEIRERMFNRVVDP